MVKQIFPHYTPVSQNPDFDLSALEGTKNLSAIHDHFHSQAHKLDNHIKEVIKKKLI